MRVVLDTNILARATPGKAGPARELFDVVAVPPHVFILSPFLLSELSRVLRYERMRKVHGLSDEEIDAYVEQVQAAALMVNSTQAISASVVPHDPEDDPVIATAVAGQAEVLCTRDRHLHHPDVRAYCTAQAIQVLTDIELLSLLRTQGAPPSTP